jgi:hypothetical protein
MHYILLLSLLSLLFLLGEWRHGMHHGLGTLTYTLGSKKMPEIGRFKNDQFVGK